jgi:hypothetical protein
MAASRPIVVSAPEPRTFELIVTAEDAAGLRRSYTIVEGLGAAVAKALEENIAEASFIIGRAAEGRTAESAIGRRRSE